MRLTRMNMEQAQAAVDLIALDEFLELLTISELIRLKKRALRRKTVELAGALGREIEWRARNPNELR